MKKKVKQKQYIVIGMGRFGTSVALTLAELGREVLAIDRDVDRIQDISDRVTHAVTLDSTDENDLKAVGIGNFDVAIVAIGKDIQASIMTTLLLKELGVKYIAVKANNDLQEKVLIKIGADKVISPEKEMGIRVANNLVSSNILDYIEVSPDYSLTEFLVPKCWVNKTIKELNLRVEYGINVMAIKRDGVIEVSPSPDWALLSGDIIVAIGSNDIEELRDFVATEEE